MIRPRPLLKPLWFCLLLLCIPAHLIFPQTQADSAALDESIPAEENTSPDEIVPDETLPSYKSAPPDGENTAETYKEKNSPFKRGLIATGETLLTNALLLSYNVIVLRSQTWALPNYDSIHGNLTVDWEWERGDGFIVNQFGHPIQGSFYFNAGRVNGFSFYESAFFSVLGSAAWETFGESGHAAMNDFLTTSIVPSSVGEILFRLYAEAVAAGVPPLAAAMVNPTAGFQRLVTDWEPPDYGRRLFEMRTSIGVGHAWTDFRIPEQNRTVFSYRGITTEVGVFVVYGNPFLQDSSTPFDHFEMNFHAGINPGSYLNLQLLTDGYLVSFCPVDTETDMMSNGLSLHYDFRAQGRMNGNWTTIDQFSNALDWTIKYQHLFSEDFSFQLKLHAGFTFMGVSIYYYYPEEDYLRNNFGFGFNEKCSLIFDHKKMGKLDMSLYHYLIWPYPNSGMNDISNGRVNWIFTDLTYSHFLTKHLSVGITGSFAWEWGHFNSDAAPDLEKSNKEVKVFLAWNI